MDAFSTTISEPYSQSQWGFLVPPAKPFPLPWPRQGSDRRPKAIRDAQGLFDDALSHHVAGRIDHAIARYKRALSLDPKHAGVHNNLGVALIAKGRIAGAITHYERALALDAGHFNAHNNLGTALVAQGRFVEAIAHYEHALILSPRHPNTHYNLGIALAGQGRIADAIAQYRRALVLKPDYAEAHNNLGNLLLAQGIPEDAMVHYKRALAIDPDHASAHNNLGNIFRDQGKFDSAMAHFDRAIDINPLSAEAHYNRAELRTFHPGDAELAALEALGRREDPDASKSLFIHFALGKALEDTGSHARSFEHLIRGNRLKRSRIDYDEPGVVELFRRIGAAFDSSVFRRPAEGGDPSQVPIFIVGMPRSGTTLIEQILASHPRVHGAGELQDLATCQPFGFPECVELLDSASLKRIGQSYLSRLPALPDGKTRLVDKLPDNFLRIGLIRLILPNARIIHSVRNPIDTCVSCYSKLFTAGQNFSYDMAELGRYYRRYRDLMTHWQSVLPTEAMLEVVYEDVVDDLEGQARRLIDYCGLPWDDACLSFHKTRRAVKTASATQVRKPLFRSSLQRWRRYEARLGPLLHALGEYPAREAHAA
jgi:tetratricopeptide (TPR) repeat protein